MQNSFTYSQCSIFLPDEGAPMGVFTLNIDSVILIVTSYSQCPKKTKEYPVLCIAYRRLQLYSHSTDCFDSVDCEWV